MSIYLFYFNHLPSVIETMDISAPKNNDSCPKSLNPKLGESLAEENRMLKKAKLEAEAKLQSLVQKLEETVTCPVCLEVPISGTIYSCPKGHLVCASCFQGPFSNCPMCRTKMFKTVSLLATTVVQNIEHKCKFDAEGCMEKLVVDKVEEHKKVCTFRPVSCPSVLCKKTVAFARLVDHLLHECEQTFTDDYDVVDHNLFAETYVLSGTKDGDDLDVDTLCWKDKFFFLALRLDAHYWNFYVQMMGLEDECKKYMVKISLMDRKGKERFSFNNHPFPISEKTEDVEKLQGLLVSTKMLEMIAISKEKADEFEILLHLEFAEVDQTNI